MAGPLAACAALFLVGVDAPAAEVPDPAWSNYGTYYDSAAGLTGTSLLNALRTTISTMTSISYDNARLSLPITDRVYGAAPGTGITGVYDRSTLVGVWDGGMTWNREHVWPQSKLGGVSNHDLFDLRPAKISTNGGRANNSYGGYDNSGNLVTGAYRMLPVRTGATTAQFFPGDADKGDIARTLFYMATRYSTLHLIATADGQTSGSDTNVGDLTAALHWNYLDMPDNFERRRNQMIYKNTEQGSASLSQNNRNPFVDHPEYVWSVFGGGANDSQITVDTATAGASTKAVVFNAVIVGANVGTQTRSVSVGKIGADPTTFGVTAAGAATSDTVGTFNAFDYGAGSKAIVVGLTASTVTAGVKSGTVAIDNTDITTGGAGEGSADGNDVITVSQTVLDHSNASFTGGAADANALTIDFGTIDKGARLSKAFSIYNLLAASGFTAGLDLDGIMTSGNASVFGTNLATFLALSGGSANGYTAEFDPTTAGSFSATYTLSVSDANLLGATNGTSLVLTLTGTAAVPEPVFFGMILPLGLLLRRRGRA